MRIGRRLTAAVTLTAVTVTWAVLVSAGSPGSAASPPTDGIQRVSLDSAGAQVKDSDSTQQAMSADGTQIAFVTRGDLTPSQFPNSDVYNTGQHLGVYVRNTRTDKTFEISVEGNPTAAGNGPFVYKPDGNPQNADSLHPSISADGRYVSFVTQANNIVGSWQGGGLLVVCDRDPDGNGVLDEPQGSTGIPDYRCVRVTQLVRPIAYMGDSRPELDKFGTRIVWSDMTCIECSEVDTYYADIDTATGITPPSPASVVTLPGSYGTVTRASLDQASISGDGADIVAWASTSTTDAIVEYHISFFGSNTMKEVDASHDVAGEFMNTASTDIPVRHPRVSDDGRYVVFDAPWDATEAIPQAFLVDTTPDGGALVKSSLVSVGPTNGSRVDGGYPAISGDGRYIAFLSDQTLAHDGFASTPSGSSCLDRGSQALAARRASSLAGSVETLCQTVVRDRLLDEARAAAGLDPAPAHLASPGIGNTCGAPAGRRCVSAGQSEAPLSLALSGYRVSYTSYANDIVANDTNTTSNGYTTFPAADVFVRTYVPITSVTTPVDFGSVQLNTSADRNVTITGTSFGPIQIDHSELTGDTGDFRINGFSCAPSVTTGNDVCSVGVTFSPTTPGTRSAHLDVVQVLTGAPTFSIDLTGNGTRTPPGSVSPGDTTPISVPNTSGATAGGSGDSMISGNGRWDVFVSSADLTGRPNPNPYNSLGNIFVRDLANPQHTLQISLHGRPGANVSVATRPHEETGAPRAPSPNGSSYSPSISDNGRFVSFITDARDIVPSTSTSSGTTLVVCDRDPNGDGVLDQVQSGTAVPDYVCYGLDYTSSEGTGLNTNVKPRLSGDGNRIVWGERNPNFGVQIVYSDLSTTPGVALRPPGNQQTVNISDNPSSASSFAGADLTDPVLSRDGRLVAVTAGGGEGPSAIVEIDLTTTTATRMDRAPGTSSYVGDNGFVETPAMSADGSVVAFAGSSNFGSRSVYVARRTGSVISSVVGSRDNFGTPASGFAPALSGDGRYLAFVTDAPNMHNGLDASRVSSTCGYNDGQQAIPCQIVARDLVRDGQRQSAGLSYLPGELVSASTKPDCQATVPAGVTCAGDQPSDNPSLNYLGSEIGFDSYATDLVAAGTNNSSTGNSFVRTWRPTLTAQPVAFGNVQVGKNSSRNFGLSATGFGPVSIDAVQTSGPNGSDFAVPAATCASPVLHAKAATDPGAANACAATVRFAPTAVGARTGFLSVRAGTGTYPVVDPLVIRQLTGTGFRKTIPPPPPNPVPQISTNPPAINFGSDIPLHLPGKKKTITVSNPGTGPLTVTGVTVVDTTVPGAKGDYTVDSSSCSSPIPPGGSCAVVVTFIGHAVGSRPAIVQIANDASGGPVLIGVTANVPTPLLTVNPGVTPTGRVVTVSGVGFAPNTTVSLSFVSTVEQAEATVDAKGAFDVPMVILANADLGPRTIVARTLLADPSLSATTPLLVGLGTLDSPVLGSADSPTVVIRH